MHCTFSAVESHGHIFQLRNPEIEVVGSSADGVWIWRESAVIMMEGYRVLRFRWLSTSNHSRPATEPNEGVRSVSNSASFDIAHGWAPVGLADGQRT